MWPLKGVRTPKFPRHTEKWCTVEFQPFASYKTLLLRGSPLREYRKRFRTYIHFLRSEQRACAAFRCSNSAFFLWVSFFQRRFSSCSLPPQEVRTRKMSRVRHVFKTHTLSEFFLGYWNIYPAELNLWRVKGCLPSAHPHSCCSTPAHPDLFYNFLSLFFLSNVSRFPLQRVATIKKISVVFFGWKLTMPFGLRRRISPRDKSAFIYIYIYIYPRD